MSTTKKIPFLGTFDETPTGQPQVIVVPQAPAAAPVAAPAPPPAGATIPTSALPAVLAAMAQGQEQAAAAVAQARAQQTALQAPVAQPLDLGAPPAAPTAGRVTNAQLQTQLQDLQQALQVEKMETYRQLRINQIRQQGGELIDGIVMGGTREAIEASLNVAQAEYQHTTAKFAAQMQAQQAQAAGQLPPGAPQGFVGAVGGQPVAPAYAQPAAPAYAPAQPQPPHAQQPQYHVGAPAPIAAQPVAQQPAQDFSAAIRQVTSSSGIRSGQFAMMRDQIFGAMRGASNGPGGSQWSFLTQVQGVTPQMAPPAPTGSVPAAGYPGQAGPPQPHMSHHPATAGAFGNRVPTHPPTQQMSPPGVPPQAYAPPGNPHAVAQTYAPQPHQLESGVPMDPAAARVAAQAAVAAHRPGVALPPING